MQNTKQSRLDIPSTSIHDTTSKSKRLRSFAAPKSEEERRLRVSSNLTTPYYSECILHSTLHSMEWKACCWSIQRWRTCRVSSMPCFGNEAIARSGHGSQQKKAEPLTIEEEELHVLWQKGLLGANNPQTLIVALNGLYFAIRRGWTSPSTITPLPNPTNWKTRTMPLPWVHRRCLQNRQRCLKGRKVKRKVVRHYNNPTNPKKAVGSQ